MSITQIPDGVFFELFRIDSAAFGLHQPKRGESGRAAVRIQEQVIQYDLRIKIKRGFRKITIARELLRMSDHVARGNNRIVQNIEVMSFPRWNRNRHGLQAPRVALAAREHLIEMSEFTGI